MPFLSDSDNEVIFIITEQGANAPIKADIVYILMKPLEWCFLIFLYLFDTRPERRIANQYLYNKED